jgi:O-antigen ligase
MERGGVPNRRVGNQWASPSPGSFWARLGLSWTGARSTWLATATILAGWVWLALVWEARFTALSGGGQVEGFPPAKVIPYLLLIVGTVLALAHQRGRRRLRAAARPVGTVPRVAKMLLASYLVVVLTSALLAEQPAIASARLVQGLIPLSAAIAWVLVLRRSPFILLGGVILAAAVHVLGTVYIWATNNRAVGYYAVEGGRWGGFEHPMAVGSAAAVLFVTSFWWVMRRRSYAAWAGMALALAGFWLAKPRAATIGAVAGSLFLAWELLRGRLPFRRQRSWLGFLPVGLGAAFVATLLLWTEPIMAWFSRGRSVEEVATLSHRLFLWAEIADLVLDRPVLGWGPGALRIGAVSQTLQGEVGFAGQAHSAPFEVLLNSGFLGFVLWIGSLAAIWTLAGRSNPAHAVLHRGLMAALLVDGLATAAVAGFGVPWMTLSLVGVWAWHEGGSAAVLRARGERRLPVLEPVDRPSLALLQKG